ncbi:MAG: ATP-dependent zinc metalloprotease FtsH [Chloroflexi bacterium]|nr:MAG: ATP-dependent zinc metalloprotease FtsH [Chloroflexota bacterium]TME41467.1 MAG: ATP-dependent zinc metalloprotease FtsH [Chloroflexota bacterium]TME52763.1 MAG: ATP-dependent zinc metalloprotease FtsH [Chloroflexota bacterium]
MLTKAADHQVTAVEINGTDGIATSTDGKKHNVVLPDCSGQCQFVTDLQNAGVDVKYDKSQTGSYLISVLLPNIILVILIAAFMWWVLRQTQSGNNQAISFGRSRARLIAGDKPAITFADVAGVDEAKQELSEIVEFLKYPEKFVALGARIPKGVLLVGPPGTGKTLLSKAVAGEAGVPFFSISGSEFVEMFVGVGASRVRDLFDQAKKNSPCIVFVDEIDAVGRQRGAGLGGGHDEREQTLNQLLVEMDGFDTNTHVIVIAATNRPDVLDPALLRPGRFDRHVTLDRPDIKGRRQILDVHARNKPLDSTVDLDVLARQTPGFSGADLANLINEAAILAARANQKVIGMNELEEAIARVIAGPERKSRRISDKEKEVIAYHETGHALVMKALPHTDPVHKVSIISRGMALGWTLSLPEEDKYLVSRDELYDQIAGIMGGRVAEEIVFNDITSGAENDIQRATQLARRMVTQWGMSEKLGTVTMGHKEELVFLGRDLGEQRNYSEEIAAVIDEEIRSIINHGYQTARTILTQQRSKMDAVVERLKVVETIDGKELDEIINGAVPQRPAAASSSAS